jgi:hypothetical protein
MHEDSLGAPTRPSNFQWLPLFMKTPSNSVFSKWPWESLWLMMLDSSQVHKLQGMHPRQISLENTVPLLPMLGCPECPWPAFHFPCFNSIMTQKEEPRLTLIWWAWLNQAAEISHVHQTQFFMLQKLYLKASRCILISWLLDGSFTDNFDLSYLCLS